MRLRIGLVLALAIAAAAPASAAPTHRLTADRVTARAELRERLARKLTTLDPQLVDPAFATGTDEDDEAFLVRGADFDKDGQEEVVDTRYHVTFDDDTGDVTETLRLDVRRGRDGALLWSKTVGSAGYVYPVFAKVGPTGGMGVLVVSYGTKWVDGLAAGASVDDTTVTAYDGKGAQVWTSTTHGGGTYSEAGGSAATYVEGTIEANPGGGSEVLLSNVQSAYAYDPLFVAGPAAAVVVPGILDGATGQLRTLAPVPTTSPITWATAVPDLDKDGREDVVVSGTTGTSTTTIALRSSDGAVLWTCRDLPGARMSYAYSVGDATGDGVADVAVSASMTTAAPLLDFQDAKVTLVDGAKGTVIWTKTGSAALSLGNVDRKGGMDVAVGDWVDGRDTFGFAVATYNAAGKALWSAKRTVSTSGLDMYMATTSWGEIGDTNGDGVREIGYAVRVVGGSSARANEGTIDGRTGKVRKDPVAGMYATKLSFDGHGSDSYRVDTKTKNVAHVTAFRGDDNRKLWDVTFAAKGATSTAGTALYAGRDRCADLVIAVHNDSTVTHYVLSGATGRPLWALSRSGQSAGKVTKPAVRTAKTYAASC